MLAVALLAAGCTGSGTSPGPTPDAATAALVVEYVQAVGAGDADRVAALAVYPVAAGHGFELVDARDLPATCVATEIAALTAAGVTAGSTVTLTSVGATDVAVDGTDETISYDLPLGLIALPDGDEVGRGVLPFDGAERVQIEPSEACDTALASTP